MATITLKKIDALANEAFGKDPVPFLGPSATLPRAFKYYDPERVVKGKSMGEWLKYSMAYWHSMRGTGADPFGPGTAVRPWEGKVDTITNAQNRIRVGFRLMEKLGIKHYCFHDTDLIPAFNTWGQYEKSLDQVMPVLRDEQARTGITPLWATANLFSNPIYVHGAATGTDPKVFAAAAIQVKKAMEMGQELGAHGYVFWGGREGYYSAWNTDFDLELGNYARFLDLAVSHADKIGFKGGFYIEPKPKEPTQHQWGHDVEAQIAFLLRYGSGELAAKLGVQNNLFDRFGFNIEGNHVTLAGHHERHDIKVASAAGKWASLDGNQGDELTGWDIDEYPTSIPIALDLMETLLSQGGFKTGGINFDAKPRRQSFNPMDLVTGHIAGMDVYAFGLLAAERLQGHADYQKLLSDKYALWSGDLGGDISSGVHSLADLAELAKVKAMPVQTRSDNYELLARMRQEVVLDTAVAERIRNGGSTKE